MKEKEKSSNDYRLSLSLHENILFSFQISYQNFGKEKHLLKSFQILTKYTFRTKFPLKIIIIFLKKMSTKFLTTSAIVRILVGKWEENQRKYGGRKVEENISYENILKRDS